jgi:hypothetical protein
MATAFLHLFGKSFHQIRTGINFKLQYPPPPLQILLWYSKCREWNEITCFIQSCNNIWSSHINDYWSSHGLLPCYPAVCTSMNNTKIAWYKMSSSLHAIFWLFTYANPEQFQSLHILHYIITEIVYWNWLWSWENDWAISFEIFT